MSPLILAIIVLGLVVLDIVVDLQLFGVSIAISLLTMSLLDMLGMTLSEPVWAISFTALTVTSIALTRKYVRSKDNSDINKY